MIMNYMQTAIMLGLIFLYRIPLILVTTKAGHKSSCSLAYHIRYRLHFRRRAAVSVLTVILVSLWSISC